MVSMYSTTYVDDIREIKEENPFESMMSRFDRAAQLLDLDPHKLIVMAHTKLSKPKLPQYLFTAIHFAQPLDRDSGPIRNS